MANVFDQFDAQAPAARPSGNAFDRFDMPAGSSPAPEPPAQPQRAPMGAGEAALRGAERGLTFGFGDEGRGVAAASTFEETAPSWLRDSVLRYSPLVGIGRLAEGAQNLIMGSPGAQDRYQAAADENRALQARAMQDQPAAAIAGELGGAVAGGVALPALAPFRAAPAAGVVARGAAGAGNLAATGALYGGIAGAGGAEGSDRLPSAAQGAGTGAVLAPVIGGAIHGAVGAGRMVADQARAATSPSTLADRLVGRAVTRDGADLAAVADDMARANVEQLPARLELPNGRVVTLPAGTTSINPNSPFAPFFRPAEDRIGGQGYTLADAAGANTRGAAGHVARVPGEGRQAARQFLEARQFGSDTVPGQEGRISERLGQILGNRGAIETADEIVARRSSQAAPAYDRAYQVQINYGSQDGQRLLALLDRIPNSARAEANNILRVSDRSGSQLIWQPDVHGGFSLDTVPNMRAFDYIKRGLDTAIERNTDAVTGRVNTMGNALTGLKREILDSLDRLNPGYAAARRQFAGESELLDALRQGADAFRPGTSTEALRRSLAGMSAGELEMYRLGAANALRDRLANAGDGADKVRLAYGNPAIREKINALVPDQQTRQQFHEFMRREINMAQTGRELGNSQTAGRLFEGEDADGLMGQFFQAGGQAASGRFTSAIQTAWNALRQINPEMRARVMSEARRVLYDPNPQTVRDFMARMNRTQMSQAAREEVLSTIGASLPRGLMPAQGQ